MDTAHTLTTPRVAPSQGRGAPDRPLLTGRMNDTHGASQLARVGSQLTIAHGGVAAVQQVSVADGTQDGIVARNRIVAAPMGPDPATRVLKPYGVVMLPRGPVAMPLPDRPASAVATSTAPFQSRADGSGMTHTLECGTSLPSGAGAAAQTALALPRRTHLIDDPLTGTDRSTPLAAAGPSPTDRVNPPRPAPSMPAG